MTQTRNLLIVLGSLASLAFAADKKLQMTDLPPAVQRHRAERRKQDAPDTGPKDWLCRHDKRPGDAALASQIICAGS